jgi:hypothetical protein
VLARLTRVFLAVALLAAWQGALLHPIDHVDEHGGFVHLADGHSHGGDSTAAGNLCDALAALTACAPGALQCFVFEPAEDSLSTVSQGAPRLAEAPPFLAQAPPILL